MECMMGMGHTGIMSSADGRGVNKSELMRALGRSQRQGEFLCLAGASEARTWTVGTAAFVSSFFLLFRRFLPQLWIGPRGLSAVVLKNVSVHIYIEVK